MINTREITFSEITSWNNLLNQSNTATFFQTKDWLKLWSKHFPSKEQILGIYDNDNLIGIAPLVQSNGTIEFLGVAPVLGSELVTDFGDIVAKISHEKEAWREILSKFKVEKIEFNFIREDSPSFQILKDLGGRAEEVDIAPYIDLPTSWDEYLTTLDRHDRHELRRKMRKLEREGVNMDCYESENDRIDEFFRLMTLGNEQKRNFLSAPMKSFFLDIVKTFFPKKFLRLCFLKLNSEYIASALVFVFKDEFLLYNSGFDPRFSHLSPGLLLKAHMIKQAIESGMKRFDFLRGAERYKFDLGGKERSLYKITF